MNEESWRPIPGFPGYEASSLGKVRSRRKVLKPSGNGKGYLKVSLYVDGQRSSQYVHRLVLLAHRGPPPKDDYHGCHDDRDRSNNRLTNLFWGSFEVNMSDRILARGADNGSAKLSELHAVEVLFLSRSGKSMSDLSRQYGIGRRSIGRLVSGKTWKALHRRLAVG